MDHLREHSRTHARGGGGGGGGEPSSMVCDMKSVM